ncbi:gephyrin-like molybdotransferase Glp [Leucobacter sp. wl10]|uniref:molybdopterin molybdotransferase MoeA n=1 Tax=Leucobacter sp. wl10 TaxID=2304677 RepID=UPI000E5BF873|nr:gephyrin-like molybdotransferase Glp [Leucobacter sp. wl10]RGE21110.1 molybdopterin molybdenumtransferase MoeA [Leucobacter sp. wl10]
MTITPEQHLGWILERVPRLPEERLPLGGAAGRTLAADIRAQHSLPLWDNSAMDGYAVRSADVASASPGRPVALRVIGEVTAGSAEDPALAPGEAVRIMTGAPVPAAADAVVAVERTSGEAGEGRWARRRVEIAEAAAAGRNIRRRGEDIAAGAVVARAGDPLTARRRAALAAAGVAEAPVSAVPRVAVIATGAELRAPGARLARGEIPETNSALISGLLAEAGIAAAAVRRSSDRPEELAELLSACARTADAVITTGGIGPGVRDVTRIALEDEPGVRAVRVAVRPGGPQCAGPLRNGVFAFALPGNPVSAAVSFELFVRPALLAMQGRREIHRLCAPAIAAADWRGAPDRLQVLPVALWNEGDALRCAPAVDPGGVSHAVGGHGGADGYALVGPDRGDVRRGETVPVMLLDGGGR